MKLITTIFTFMFSLLALNAATGTPVCDDIDHQNAMIIKTYEQAETFLMDKDYRSWKMWSTGICSTQSSTGFMLKDEYDLAVMTIGISSKADESLKVMFDVFYRYTDGDNVFIFGNCPKYDILAICLTPDQRVRLIQRNKKIILIDKITNMDSLTGILSEIPEIDA